MSDYPPAYQATPNATLREQIMDSRIPKNEREWWASRHIEQLERDLAAAKEEMAQLQHDQLRDQLAAARQRETVAIASWDEEQGRGRARFTRVVEWITRAARAEAELALLKPKYERHCREYNNKLAELRYAENMQRQAEAELAAERARLDWLGGHGYLLDQITHGASKPHPDDYWICTDGERAGKGATPRAAIDAAMPEEAK